MTVQWYRQIVDEAMQLHGNPEIFNTDQGSQFTSEVFIGLLKDNKVQVSIDGKGRAIDNIFIECLWRTVKYQHLYLHVADDGLQFYEGLKNYFQFYNTNRPYQSLQYKTPEAFYKA